jgi:hypothetical protein
MTRGEVLAIGFQQDDSHIGIRHGAVKGRVELLQELRILRVALLGPIQGQERYAVACFIFDYAHGLLPLS